MKINDLNAVNTQNAVPKTVQANDSVSKNIQTQIINAQKKLQDLSSNEELSMEEKMKRRQEILKEISDLHNQLRQHQLEQRKEKQEMKGSADVLTPFAEDKTEEKEKPEEQKSGLSAQSMMSMISADAAQMQARVQGSVSLKLEGRINVLESEIKLDSMRGNVEAKEEELHKLEDKANKAFTSQMETIAEANKQANASKDEEKEDIKISIN